MPPIHPRPAVRSRLAFASAAPAPMHGSPAPDPAPRHALRISTGLALRALAGIGFGTLSGPLGPIVVSDVARTHAGTASATLRTAQQLGGALGIALVGSAYFSVDGHDAAARLAGIHAAGLLLAAYVACGLCAGVAGLST